MSCTSRSRAAARARCSPAGAGLLPPLPLRPPPLPPLPLLLPPTAVTPPPTLIVWGSKDRMIPAWHALSAQRAVPGCRVELFEGAGHFPHLDDPDRFARVLREFMSADG